MPKSMTAIDNLWWGQEKKIEKKLAEEMKTRFSFGFIYPL